MKNLIVAVCLMVSGFAQAQSEMKQSKGTTVVTKYVYSEGSNISIHGAAAKLLWDSLTVEETGCVSLMDPMGTVGQGAKVGKNIICFKGKVVKDFICSLSTNAQGEMDPQYLNCPAGGVSIGN
ncbi:MAG: hypothetical protein V4736_15115 [Bdellovibrionota bacterium]